MYVRYFCCRCRCLSQVLSPNMSPNLLKTKTKTTTAKQHPGPNFPQTASIISSTNDLFIIQPGNYYKMSRNKDKYDSTNRRQQIFLSAEDIAAGKKTNWTGLEITGM